MSRKPLDLSGNPNHRDLLIEAERLGCEVQDVRGTGEVDVKAPGGAARVRLNHRRKDGAIALVSLLRKLQRAA